MTTLQGNLRVFNDCDLETTICRNTPKEKTPFKCECLNDAYENGSVKICKRNGEFLKIKKDFDFFSFFFCIDSGDLLRFFCCLYCNQRIYLQSEVQLINQVHFGFLEKKFLKLNKFPYVS